MLDEQLRDQWRTRTRAVPIHPVMTFAPEGLVLGAGTILVPAESIRRLKSLDGQEQRILALLSAVYDKAVSPSVLKNIERAAEAWSLGEDCFAYIHLAHAGLRPPADLRSAAWRLFVADAAIKAGATTRAIFQALKIDCPSIGTVEKLYNPDQPRVPAGSGRISGQWTRLLSWMGSMEPAEIAELGLYAARIAAPAGGAVSAFGLLFIPSPNNVHVEGEVPGLPGLRFSWNRDEARLLLGYDLPGGAQRTVAIQLDSDKLRDESGEVVGRIIGGNRVAIDTIAVLPDLVKEDEPRLCPGSAPDVAGSDQGKPYDENRSRQYEDFVKLLINPPPEGPTPSGFVYYLPNPTQGGKMVSFDDCKKTNGMLFDFKGEGYTKLTDDLPTVMTNYFMDQAARQIAASGGRPIVWIFAEQSAALFARKLFDFAPGVDRITVGYIPRIRSGRQ